jgi:hypothetical protein
MMSTKSKLLALELEAKSESKTVDEGLTQFRRTLCTSDKTEI